LAHERAASFVRVFCERRGGLQHPKGLQVCFEDRLRLGPLVGILLAHPNDDTQRLELEAAALGLDAADIGVDLGTRPFELDPSVPDIAIAGTKW
jgi:hypothetical protein